MRSLLVVNYYYCWGKNSRKKLTAAAGFGFFGGAALCWSQRVYERSLMKYMSCLNELDRVYFAHG